MILFSSVFDSAGLFYPDQTSTPFVFFTSGITPGSALKTHAFYCNQFYGTSDMTVGDSNVKINGPSFVQTGCSSANHMCNHATCLFNAVAQACGANCRDAQSDDPLNVFDSFISDGEKDLQTKHCFNYCCET